jgi:heptosyltransferase-2
MKNPNKILVIRFSSIGDLVLSSPVYRALKKRFPGVEIHLAVKEKLKGILQENPNIDDFKVLETSIWSLAFQLRNENYDCIIDLHNNLRSFILKLIIAKPSFTVAKKNISKWRMVTLKHKISVPHIVDRYLDTIVDLGAQNDGLGLEFFTDSNSKSWGLDFLAKDPSPYSVFAIGGQFATKRLPSNKWVELANKLNARIVIIGGKEDLPLSQALAKETTAPIENLCGQLSINQSAEIIRHAQKVYTNDTGMMHIAAAFNKDIDVFWGNTLPELGMYPYYPTKNAANFQNHQVMNLGCRPCSKIGFHECPKGHFKCMTEQII